MGALEDMLYSLDKDPRTDDGGADQWVRCVKGLTESQVWKVLDSLGVSARNVTPMDFVRAKRRMFPPEKCVNCDDTGQLWDGERYEFCTCDMGAHMAQVNARIASESSALSPVWARALPEAARRHDGNVVLLERLCGQCGTPLASHTEGDRKFCDTLAPKGGAS